MQIIPVILAGGSGKRLWPISRKSYPKQFFSLVSEKTMFQETLARLEKIKSVNLKRPIIICNTEHRFLVIEQINELDKKYQAILVEPIGRNTAPAVGVKDLIVVQTSDAVLIADKKASENVSKIVDLLTSASREEGVFHRKVKRPWGTFDSIDETDHFKVKRLTVNPGAKLSLQMHHQREEFWVVVTGTAKVTRGEEVFILEQSQTIHIPIGMRHSLENPNEIPLEIIEIQIGDYLGEDDIVRFDDKYGRA